MRCGLLVDEDIASYHEALRSSPRETWLANTEPLAGYSDEKPAIQHGGARPLELRNCKRCHSTLARIYDGDESNKEG